MRFAAFEGSDLVRSVAAVTDRVRPCRFGAVDDRLPSPHPVACHGASRLSDFSRVRVHTSGEFATRERDADETARGAGRDWDGLSTRAGEGTSPSSLDPGTRRLSERHLGVGLERVRIHDDESAHRLTDSIGARGLTIANDVYLGRDVPRAGPERASVVAHELTHVAQQAQAGVPAIQPKLKFTGTPANLARVVSLLNGGLTRSMVSVAASGDVSLVPRPGVGTGPALGGGRDPIHQPLIEDYRRRRGLGPDEGPSDADIKYRRSAAELAAEGRLMAREAALESRLRAVIGDPHDVVMSVSAGSHTIVGSYATGDVDIDDVERLGVHSLIHEIEEQYQKQVRGVAYGSETTGAHASGITAESEVIGATRGPQRIVSSSVNADGTINAVAEVPYTFPDGRVETHVMTITRNNITSVVRK
jgi:hypothetical protein